MCKMRPKTLEGRWIKRYRLCFLVVIFILGLQIFLAMRFFSLGIEKNTSSGNGPSVNKFSIKGDAENSVSSLKRGKDALPIDDEDAVNIHRPRKNLSSNKVGVVNGAKLRLEELDFVPVCEIRTKEAISAIHRAKTQKCKQKIANLTCLMQNGALYPKTLPNYCVNKQFVKLRALGCYKDEQNFRLLSGYFGSYKESNSPENCVNLCLQSGFQYAGVQYSFECFCGDEEPPSSAKLPDSSCNLKCPADPHKACGGYYTINIYETGIKKFAPQIASTPETATNRKTVRIVFLLTLNGRALRQVIRLIKILYHKDHYYFIHVDVRQDYLFRELQKLEKKFKNIKMARKRFATIWGGASLLTMLLSSMKELLNLDWKWDFVLNLSESDYPVKKIDKLVDFLTANKNRNFVKSHGRETQRFIQKQGLDKTFIECDNHMWRTGDRKLPWNIQIDGGSDWIALSRNFVSYILQGKQDELILGLLKIFEHTLLPAESFFHTVLRNSKFCDTYIDNNLHVTNWKRKLGCKCQYKHVVDWCGCSPNDFKPDDWVRIQSTESRQLFFARKFEPVVSQSVILQLELWLFDKDFTEFLMEKNQSDWVWFEKNSLNFDKSSLNYQKSNLNDEKSYLNDEKSNLKDEKSNLNDQKRDKNVFVDDRNRLISNKNEFDANSNLNRNILGNKQSLDGDFNKNLVENYVDDLEFKGNNKNSANLNNFKRIYDKNEQTLNDDEASSNENSFVLNKNSLVLNKNKFNLNKDEPDSKSKDLNIKNLENNNLNIEKLTNFDWKYLNINSYWQSVYHKFDMSPPPDDALLTVAFSAIRNKLKTLKSCRIKPEIIDEITSYHDMDVYQSSLVMFSGVLERNIDDLNNKSDDLGNYKSNLEKSNKNLDDFNHLDNSKKNLDSFNNNYENSNNNFDNSNKKTIRNKNLDNLQHSNNNFDNANKDLDKLNTNFDSFNNNFDSFNNNFDNSIKNVDNLDVNNGNLIKTNSKKEEKANENTQDKVKKSKRSTNSNKNSDTLENSEKLHDTNSKNSKNDVNSNKNTQKQTKDNLKDNQNELSINKNVQSESKTTKNVQKETKNLIRNETKNLIKNKTGNIKNDNLKQKPVNINQKYSFEVNFKPKNMLKLNATNPFSKKILTFLVSSEYDQKEQIFRNFPNILGPYSEPTLLYSFNLNSKVLNCSFIWVDPAGRLSEVNEILLDESHTLNHIKLSLKPPLLPGIWTVKLIIKNSVVALTNFLISPLEFFSNNKIAQNQVAYVHSGSEFSIKDFNGFYDKFLPENRQQLEQIASSNARRFETDLLEWIDSLFAKFYSVNQICVVSKYNFVEICGFKFKSCSITKWSSLSPDPKSQFVGYDHDLGTFNII